MKKITLITLASTLVMSCERDKTPLVTSISLTQARSNLCGTYTGNYAGGRESFQINSDGTFVQTFVKGGATSYSSAGKWEVRTSNVNPITFLVDFTPFMNVEKLILDGGRPMRGESMFVQYNGVGSSLVFFEDISYYIVKDSLSGVRTQ